MFKDCPVRKKKKKKSEGRHTTPLSLISCHWLFLTKLVHCWNEKLRNLCFLGMETKTAKRKSCWQGNGFGLHLAAGRRAEVKQSNPASCFSAMQLQKSSKFKEKKRKIPWGREAPKLQKGKGSMTQPLISQGQDVCAVLQLPCLELWLNWTLSVGSRDCLLPLRCTALGPLADHPFPCGRVKISWSEQHSFLRPGGSLQIPSSWGWGQQTACMASLTSTDPSEEALGSLDANPCDRHLSPWTESDGSAGWPLGFLQQTICSDTSQSLGLFQMFSLKLLHVSDELAPASRLCLQPRYSAQALSPV